VTSWNGRILTGDQRMDLLIGSAVDPKTVRDRVPAIRPQENDQSEGDVPTGLP
jgi:hypothetical protein